MMHLFFIYFGRFKLISYLEPINSTTINNCRELPYPIPEAVTNGTHCQNHVQLFSNNLHKEIEQRHWTAISLKSLIPLSIQLPHFLAQFYSFLSRKQIGYFPGIEQITDVLQKRFLLDLGVAEEKSAVLIGGTGFSQDHFDIFPPLVRAVQAGDLHLEKVVLGYVRGQAS